MPNKATHKSRRTRRSYLTTLFAVCMLLLVLPSDIRADHGFDLPFTVGEQLEYRIYWGVLPVGSTVVTTEWIEEDGRQLIQIRFRTRSNKTIATVYPVRSVIESVIDPETFLPVRFTKNLREGRHRAHEVTTFDFELGKAKWVSHTKDETQEYDINQDTRDLISFMYIMRSNDFSPGQVAEYMVMADEKIYELLLEAHGIEPVKLSRYGDVESIRLEPTARFEGLFVRKGQMTIWVSNDNRKLSTKILAEIPVASIRLMLHRVSGPGDDFWITRGSGTE